MPSPAVAVATLTPTEHVADLTIEQLSDFLSCPFLYRQRHVLEQHGTFSSDRQAARLALRALPQVMREQQQTGQALAPQDIEAVVREEADTTVESALADAVRLLSLWHDQLGRSMQPVAVDTRLHLELDDDGDRWAISGRIPIAFTAPATTYPQVAVVQVVPLLWSADRIRSDLLLPLTLLGARQALDLHELTSIRLHQVTYAGEVREVAPLVDDRRCQEALGLAAAARAGLRAYLAALDGAQPWPPARGSQDCSGAACPFVTPCVEAFGGSVRWTSSGSGTGPGTNPGPGSR